MSHKWEKYLDSIYFDPAHPGSFGGPDKLYRAVKQDGIYKISRSQINKWLQSIDTYTLHKEPRRNFKRRKVYVPRIDFQWDADLMDMTRISTYNDGFNYVLLVIDIFSRYVWSVPLKTKKGSEVMVGFEKILQLGRQPKNVRTDKGTEFTNNALQSFFKNKAINHFVTQNETKANYAERAIKTIKGRIYRYFTENQSYRYIDRLQDFTEAYNHSYHRSIKMEPVKVNKSNELKVHDLQYHEKPKKKKKRFKIKIGDQVRLVHHKRPFTREYEERWTGEIFKVVDRFWKGNLPIYKIKDYDGESILGTFYEKELQVVTPSDVFKIEKILKSRKRKGFPKEYFVKWLRWPPKYNSWITEKNMV